MAKKPPTDTVTAPLQRCKGCGNDKPMSPSEWVYSHGAPHGNYCRMCARVRHKQRQEKRRQMMNLGLATLQPPEVKGKVAATTANMPVAIKTKQMDVALALRAGASTLNENAVDVLTRVVGYAKDIMSPHHEWALKMLLERILPSKMYAALGLQAAGIDSAGGDQSKAKPAVTVIVSVAAPTGGRVIDVETVTAEETT